MRKKETRLINSFFYNRQKNVTLMHRYQVAKIKKMKNFKMRLQRK
jgi:hypothetical protein